MSGPYYLRFADKAEAIAKLREAKLRTLGELDIAGVKVPQWIDDPNLIVLGDNLWRPNFTPTIHKDIWIVNGGGRVLGTPDSEAEARALKATFDDARKPDDLGNLPPEATVTRAVRNDRDHSKPVIQGTKRDGYFVNYTGDELPECLKPYDAKPVTPFTVPAGHRPEEIAAREAKPETPL